MIDTKALRSKVLDLAIQGKLTEQLESDGTAEELFAQIQEEKQKLIKEGKIKKGKPLPTVSDEEIPFEIPKNWKFYKMNTICQQITDGTHKTPHYQEKGIPFLSVKNISSGIMDFSDTKFISIEEHNSLIKRCKPEKNDILICRIGTLGKAIRIDVDLEFSIFVSLGLLKTGNRLLSDYIVFVLNSKIGIEWIKSHKAGNSMHADKLNLTDLSAMPIPLAPLAEQKRIVERVEEIFKLLDIIEEAQKKYSADAEILKSKLINMGIQGKLTKQLDSDGTAEELYQHIQEEKQIILNNRKGRKDNSIIPIDSDVPFDIPKKWKWIRFGETGFFRKGPFGSSLTKAMFVPKNNDTIKVYEQQHAIQKNSTLGTYYITKEYFESKMSGFEVCAGDIIVSCAGTIGETYVMPENIEKGIINQALMRITLVPSIEKRFFLYYFDANLKQDAQSGNGSAITNIPPFDVLKNWYFPLPPLAEQKRIADTLDEVLRVIG